MRQLVLNTSLLGKESKARTAQVTGDLEPHTKACLGEWMENGLERVAPAVWLVISENMTQWSGLVMPAESLIRSPPE